MNREIRVGLWKKKSQKGNTYYSGKFQLDGKDYYLTLFNNDKKGNEKAPDFQLFIRDSINTQENEKVAEIPPKIEPGKVNGDEVFKTFGDTAEISDDLLPF